MPLTRSSRQPGMRILIVEDQVLVAEGLRLILTDAGHQVTGIAADTAQAVELAGRTRPELALVDIQLAHGTNGIEAARIMRVRYGVHSLLVTGNADLARASRDSALGCLEKPYLDCDLLAAVQAAQAILRGEAPPMTGRLELFRMAPCSSAHALQDTIAGEEGFGRECH